MRRIFRRAMIFLVLPVMLSGLSGCSLYHTMLTGTTGEKALAAAEVATSTFHTWQNAVFAYGSLEDCTKTTSSVCHDSDVLETLKTYNTQGTAAATALSTILSNYSDLTSVSESDFDTDTITALQESTESITEAISSITGTGLTTSGTVETTTTTSTDSE